jgi:branched-chain amino acid transport system permease protein
MLAAPAHIDLRPPPAWMVLPRNFLPLAAGLLLAATLHFVVRPLCGPFASKLLLDIGINVILAVSLTLVNGFTGQFSIGHAGFMAVGGYIGAAVTYYGSFRLFGDGGFHGGILSATSGPLPLLTAGDGLFLLACIVGGIAAALAGYVVGLPSLRLRGDYLAIVTLGFGEIARVVIQSSRDQLWTAPEIAAASWPNLMTHLGGALGFAGIPYYTTLFWVYLFVALTLVAAYRIKQSSYGRGFLSIREDEVAAEAMGVHATRYKVRAFVIAAFLAGVAGVLYAHLISGSINAGELGFQKSFDLVIMVVLGGMGSISGSTLAAVLLTVLPEGLRAVAEYRMILYSLALILMMILRPQGLFGLHEIWELPRLWRRKRA